MKNLNVKQNGKHWIGIATIAAALVPGMLSAQQASDSLLQQATLQNVVQYALKHQPAVQTSLVNEQITETTIKGKLADWYPQVNFNYVYQHNFQLQTSIFQGSPVKIGVDNTSSLQFTATQTIFNRDVLLAARSAGIVRQQAKQNTASTKIDVAVNVSKAFYDVLTTSQQIKVSKQDIARLERSYQDAYNQYKAGITDKTDYKRAQIALNNTKALLRSYEEALKAKQEYLKALMGYPVAHDLPIVYDTLAMEGEVGVDTLQQANYATRIEYQQLVTQRRIQEYNLLYNKWSYLPSLSVNGAYNFNYLNNSFSKLYRDNVPNSYAGVTLALPIFQGGKRKYNTRQAEWQLKSIDLQIIDLKNSINAEYAQAMASYKSSLANYYSLKDNLDLAQEVYDVIQLQYRSGVKTYLEVITAESDLRTARINYYNALYQVLAGKIDVEKSLGQINY
ncbi:MAG: TolC family protein [Chitinophagaceae bacterium]